MLLSADASFSKLIPLWLFWFVLTNCGIWVRRSDPKSRFICWEAFSGLLCSLHQMLLVFGSFCSERHSVTTFSALLQMLLYGAFVDFIRFTPMMLLLHVPQVRPKRTVPLKSRHWTFWMVWYRIDHLPTSSCNYSVWSYFICWYFLIIWTLTLLIDWLFYCV